MLGYENYKAPRHFIRNFDVSSSTLRRWAENNEIRVFRNGEGTRRLYNVDDVLRKIGISPGNTDTSSKIGIVYARVSTSKQKEDLRRQVDDLVAQYPDYEVVTDVASGVNFHRKGLRTVLDKAIRGMVKEIVVSHRDRLARVGFELLEFVFERVGTKLLVQRGNEETDEQDLASDLLAITTVFVASHHGKRAAENKKRRKLNDEKAKARDQTSKNEKDSSVSDEGAEKNS